MRGYQGNTGNRTALFRGFAGVRNRIAQLLLPPVLVTDACSQTDLMGRAKGCDCPEDLLRQACHHPCYDQGLCFNPCPVPGALWVSCCFTWPVLPCCCLQLSDARSQREELVAELAGLSGQVTALQAEIDSRDEKMSGLEAAAEQANKGVQGLLPQEGEEGVLQRGECRQQAA